MGAQGREPREQPRAEPREQPRERTPAGAIGGRAPGFLVVPAVDLLGEEAVRLRQGDFDRVALRAGDPVELVARLAGSAPPLIHVVDLEGARSGRLRPELISRLVDAAGDVPVQASGGIRSVADAQRLLDVGASRVVVGTAAFAADGALASFADALGPRLVVAVDARDGRVAVSGWERSTGLDATEAAAACAAAGVRRLLCTAVDRDGTMSGPDLALLRGVREASNLPVLAAGGIRGESDLVELASLGLEGAVVGRAVLEGRIRLGP
jgi:phosphoribosylformimino-5-aminoimidazole carboxamide ribotide isomerase